MQYQFFELCILYMEFLLFLLLYKTYIPPLVSGGVLQTQQEYYTFPTDNFVSRLYTGQCKIYTKILMVT
jgi:hypothetical protein